MIQNSFTAFLILLLFGLSLSATAQQKPRMLIFGDTTENQSHLTGEYSLESLIYDRSDARRTLISFLNNRYESERMLYPAAAISVDPDRLNSDAEYDMALRNFIGYLMKNSFGRVEAFYAYDRDLAGDEDRIKKLSEAFIAFQEKGREEGEGGYFDGLHLDVRPTHHSEFRMIGRSYSRENQSVFDAVLNEIRSAQPVRDARIPVTLNIDGTAFFGIPDTWVHSTGKSLGMSLSEYADRINIRVNRDYATGTETGRGGVDRHGMVMTVRPVIKVLTELGKRVDITFDTMPILHEEMGSRSTFSDLPGFSDKNSGRRSLERELEIFMEMLTREERRNIDFLIMNQYSSYATLRR